MSSYSIGNASADSRHSRSVRMSGAGWPDLVQARTTGARASNSAPSTVSQMSSGITTGGARSADPGRTVLDAVRKAMPQLHISSWSQYSRCPNLELRGKDSVTGSSNPDVYVDGTRTVDTCPLVTIQAMDAQRIEVYSLGVTSRPGYPSSGHGLILIFLQRSDTTGS